MDAVVEREGLRHFRPLLGVAKADLVAFCQARDQAFASDPSNEDERYARVRLRRILSQLRADGLETEGLLRLARRAAEADDAIGRAADDLDRRLGEGVLDANALFSEPMAVVYRVIGRRIGAVGGRADDRIRLEQIEALATALREARKAGRAHSANMAGVLVRLTSKGELRFEAEPERRTPSRSSRKV